jgi:hypothetical protein
LAGLQRLLDSMPVAVNKLVYGMSVSTPTVATC